MILTKEIPPLKKYSTEFNDLIKALLCKVWIPNLKTLIPVNRNATKG
jgi:hypothetical protein